MKLIDENSEDELAPFRETIDSWLLILVGEDPRPIHRKIQENGGKITFAQYKYNNYWPNNYLRFKEWIERYIIVNNELPSGVHCIEQRQINIYSLLFKEICNYLLWKSVCVHLNQENKLQSNQDKANLIIFMVKLVKNYNCSKE